MAEAKTATRSRRSRQDRPTRSRPARPPTKADSKPMRPDAEHKEPLQIQILEKMSQLMTAAFGLVAALAWNEAMKLLLKQIFGDNEQLRVLFGYAFVITIVAVLASLWVANVTHKVKAALGHGHPPMTA
jgi:hypothetical protein